MHLLVLRQVLIHREKLYRILQNEELEYNEDYTDGMIALRFDDAVFLNI